MRPRAVMRQMEAAGQVAERLVQAEARVAQVEAILLQMEKRLAQVTTKVTSKAAGRVPAEPAASTGEPERDARGWPQGYEVEVRKF